MSSIWVAGATAVVGIASGVMSSRSAKKNTKEQMALQREQLALMREQMNNFKRLIAGYPKETQEFLNKISSTYAQLNNMLAEAKARGDNQAAAMFQAQRDLVDVHLDAELEAIGANKEAIIGSLNEMADESVRIISQDEDAKDRLRDEYKKQADLAVGNLIKMAEASGARVDSILKTGLAPDAAAKLSQARQGVADLTRKTAEIEAARGKGGSASRTTATELEGIKVIGEIAANLRTQAFQELQQAGQIQGQLQQAAGQRMAAMQPTRGAAELAARSPYQQMAAGTVMQAGQQSLTAQGNALAETRRLTGAEGETSLARQDQYNRDRMSLLTSQSATEIGVKQREQDLISAATAGQASQARSMADIMGAQAQNYANMAAQSQAQAMQGYALAARTGAGMMAGYGTTGTAAGAGQGGLYGGFGIGSMPTAPNSGNMPKGTLGEGYPVGIGNPMQDLSAQYPTVNSGYRPK